MGGLPPEGYGGYKDANEAWVAGVLAVGAGPAAVGARLEGLEVPGDFWERWEERVAIMVADGGRPRAEAQRLAWARFQPPGEEQ